MFNPVATYRIQFHKGFDFEDFERIIPYLSELGVSTIYASPIFEATPGSNHGYDVVDPHRINPEIGTIDQLRSISKKLKKLSINWLQDIVPNHMAFHPNNAWLMDVLEKGQQSPFASFFDIIWNVPAFNGRLMVPFLGNPLDKVISDGQLSIKYQNEAFHLVYADQVYPVNLQSYHTILQSGSEQPKAIQHLITKGKTKKIDEIKKLLSEAYQEDAAKQYITSVLKSINKNSAMLQHIADEQYYQLSFWADSDHEINYRRFFTVNGLICLNIQDEAVFNHYHQFIKQLMDEEIIQGLRVDHIDGLYDPQTYLQRLRTLAGDEAYIVVEKILEAGEKFPLNWPVQGNTGYDFLATVNNMFTSAESRKPFTDFYKELANDHTSITNAILKKKAAILDNSMGGELQNLLDLFISLKLASAKDIKKAGGQLKTAIEEFLVRCPVYRYYGNNFPLDKVESIAIKDILGVVVKKQPDLSFAVGLLKKAFLKNTDANALRFYQRCMQFTGPLMAKGVEDTLMYTYDRFIGHNEVGDSPAAFGIQTDTFHKQMVDRQQNWPLSLNATSTHDTKRGEDVRARLNVLTDIAEEWLANVTTWQKDNAHLKQNNAPDANDEYLIYQTLTGFYPMPGQDAGDIKERIQAYLTKALREAKTHTQWAEPNEKYENAVLDFVAKLLNSKTPFWESFTALQTRIADYTVVNSLAQVLLKFTCPGVPDIYQGCELYDFSLVDPDNRRQVDYELRKEYLKKSDLKSLWNDRYNGEIKLWLTNQLLQLRKQNTAIFTQGNYIPLKVSGKYSSHIVAFARQYLNNWLIVVAPLQLAAVGCDDVLSINWADTAIAIPKDAPLKWENTFTQKELIISESLSVSDVFKSIPLAVLRSVKPDNNRSAGVIMHITSLPSTFGIGDMGLQARKFADFLSASYQKYWQLLPLNPTTTAANHSPYSSFSSMAGNTLLISPDELVSDGLLDAKDLKQYQIITNTVNYEYAITIKKQLLDKSFEHYQQSGILNQAFADFKNKEANWLDDFALYEVLKAHYRNEPWHNWPDVYKYRDKKTLVSFSQQNKTQIERSKWAQFIFFKQWQALKKYGNDLGISFLGDMPFYVSYDSVDVWVYPEIFKLDKDKAMLAVSGVPPDHFNSNGQLWGMPVYDWDKLAKSGYTWWVNRMRKNLEFFDQVRLDHFRAFYDYWEVPAGETTAINGKWKAGPGVALFQTLQTELNELPFIAEDLGEINSGVLELRDALNIPGMNVLQFAFGKDMPVSPHSPHNHKNSNVTYTGTHDNNTTLGWYRQNATNIELRNLSDYANIKVTARNINRVLINLCYASASQTAIVPLQDILGLDESSRMNIPASEKDNWIWQLKQGQLTKRTAQMLRDLTKKYNRA